MSVPTRSGTSLAATTFAAGLLLVACSSAGSSPGKVAAPDVLAALPPCAHGETTGQLLVPGKLPGPAAAAVQSGRISRSWSLDDGAIGVASAPAADQPVLSESQAACNLLAAVAPNGAPVAGYAPLGSVLAYGRLTVSTALAHDELYVGQRQSQPSPPVFTDRPAWMLTVVYARSYSCPAQVSSPSPQPTPTPARALPRSWFYAVFAVDAVTGRDAITYTESAPGGCGRTPTLLPASSSVPYENVSLPWRNAVIGAGGSTGTLEVQVADCDVLDQQGAWVSRTGPEVQVEAERPVGGSCTGSSWKRLPLHPATVSQTIPAASTHAPVGPIDHLPGQPAAG